MKPGRLILILAGILGLIAFFLPFLTFEKSILGAEVINKSMSGYTALRTFLDSWGIYDYDKGKVLTELIADFGQNADSPKDLFLFVGLMFALTGPIIFIFYSLSYLIKGLINKKYTQGIFFTIIYVVISWLSFMFLTHDSTTVLFGKHIGIKFEFLKMVSVGFWLTIISMVLAFISSFLGKTKKA